MVIFLSKVMTFVDFEKRCRGFRAQLRVAVQGRGEQWPQVQPQWTEDTLPKVKGHVRFLGSNYEMVGSGDDSDVVGLVVLLFILL